MVVRILPLSTIDDNRTILQEVLRLRKYLEENPIRNIFFINTNYVVGTIAYDVSDILINSELDVTASADDALVFNNGYIGIIDSIGDIYVTVQGVQTFRGEKGDTGATGNGISGIAKTGTSGLIDTYTITFSNGSTSTFTVTNGADGQDGATGATGNGISGIAKTGTSGLIDTYTITFTNGTTTTFTVTNGADGVGIPAGGTDGQVLTKDSDTDYQTKWSNPSSGGGALISENLIINPDMKINQRGVSGTISYNPNTPSANYFKDRWYIKQGSYSLSSTVGKENQLISAKISQFIEFNKGKFSGKYLVCGVTANRTEQQSSSPTVKLYNSLGVQYTAVDNISKNYHVGSDLYMQTGFIFDINDINENDYIEFEIDNSSESFSSYITNAFCYLTDSKDYFNNTNAIPVISPNYADELEKCKYYYERTNISSSAIKSGFLLTNAVITQFTINVNTKISTKRISPTFTLPASSSYKILSYTDQTGNRRTVNVELNELNYINENGIYAQLSVTHNISGIETYSITSLLDVSASVRYISIDAEIYP